MYVRGKRVLNFIVLVVALTGVALSLFPVPAALAAEITNRSLTLQPGASSGGSQAGGVVNHLFTFTLPSTTTIYSISFTYCTTANIDVGGTCTTPAGLSTTSATLGTQTGLTFSSLVNTTNGVPYVTSSTGVTPTGTASASIQLLGVTNPNNTNCGSPPASNNCTFYVQIASYTSTNATGTPVDVGTVAASTTTQIQLTGTMPESLIFCTGVPPVPSATKSLI